MSRQFTRPWWTLVITATITLWIGLAFGYMVFRWDEANRHSDPEYYRSEGILYECYEQ
jgi:hypothetical protein